MRLHKVTGSFVLKWAVLVIRDFFLIIMHSERRHGHVEILLEKWIGVGFRGWDVIHGIFL